MDDLSWARLQYERVVTKFPSCAFFWKRYLDLELLNENYQQVTDIFGRTLSSIPDLELWQKYVGYIKKTRLNREDKKKAKQDITKAFSIAVERVGLDINSADLWLEYANFMRTFNVGPVH